MLYKKSRFFFLLLLLFSFSIRAQFVINGSAKLLADGEYQLTAAQGGKVGTIWSEQKISLNDPFEIELELYFGTKDGNGADGITFSLQPKSNTVGVPGGGLGIGGISPSLITEMDTYRNGSYGDPGYDHIALVKNTVDHRGADNLVTPTQIVQGKNNVEDGGWYNFKATWDPTNQVYQVFVNGIQRLSYEGDVINEVFKGDPNVFWGFTSSTGGLNNDQRVRIINTTIIDLFNCTETPNNKTFCDATGPATVTFDFSNAQADATYEWFDTKDRANSLGTGLSYTDNAVTVEKDVYVVATFPKVVNTGGTVGPTPSGANGIQETQFFDGNNRDFTVSADLVIKSVDVALPVYNGGCFAAGTTLGNTIDILNSTGTIVSSTNILANCGGVTTIPLNVSLSPGSYTMKLRNYTFNSFQVTGDGTEKSIPGVITLEDNTISNTWGTRNYSSTFFNWEIETAGGTGTAECLFSVKAEKSCPPCVTFPSVSIGNDFTYCSANDTTIEVTTTAANILWSTNETTKQIEIGEGTFTVEVWDDPNCPSFENIIVNRECPADPVELLPDTIEVCAGITDTILASNVENTNWSSSSPFNLINDSTISVNLYTDAKFQVSNYIRLNILSDNIDFEDPKITSNFKQMDANLIPGWETTAPDNQMEIWKSGFQGVPAYRGEQFIEINSSFDAALYQEMSTIPGEVIGINLAHRGRTGPDEMRLLAGPPSGPFTVINNYLDGTNAWGYYTEYYTVPSGQIETRFIFETVSCNGAPCTGSGNFLDAIEFFRVETQVDSIYVKVNSTPIVDLGNDTTLCKGTSLELDAGNPSFNHLWNTTETTQIINKDTSGQYIVYVYDNATSCSISDTINVVFEASPIVSLGNDTSLCAGSSVTLDAGNELMSHLWSTTNTTSAITASTSGDYSVAVTDANGCVGRDTVVITVLPQPIVDLGQDTTVCLGESIILDAGNSGFNYEWSTIESSKFLTVNQTGDYGVRVYGGGCEDFDTIKVNVQSLPVVDLGKDTSICAGDILTLDAGNPSLAHVWSNSKIIQSIEVGNTGAYHVRVTDANGCIGSDTISVTVLPQPTVDLGQDTLICFGDTLLLSAQNAGFNYEWNTLSSNQVISITQAGTFHVKVFNSRCEAFDTIFVDVKSLPVVDLGDDQSICFGEEVTLDANNTVLSHSWNTGQSSQAIIVKTPGLYVVSVLDSDGCVGIDSVEVFVNSLPTVSLNSPLTDVCLSAENVALNFNPMGGVLSGNGLSGADFNPQASGLIQDQPNWITYEYTDANNCTAKDSLSITLRVAPDAPQIDDRVICSGEKFIYGFDIPGVVAYSWYDERQVIIDSDAFVEIENEGLFQVEVSDEFCSSKSDFFEVTVLDPQVTALANPEEKVFQGNKITLSVEEQVSDYSYQWFKDDEFIGGSALLEVVAMEDAVYTVKAEVEGCEASSNIEVDVVLPVVVPSMFTPNGDGLNDTWMISGIESYDVYNVKVYSRWGNVVYENYSAYEDWDGTVSGSDIPVAVYYYVIELENGEFPSVKGSVTIMR